MKLSVAGPDGVHEAYAYAGGKPFDAGLPCVVFIHGAMNDHSVWTLLARWFAHHGHSVLAGSQVDENSRAHISAASSNSAAPSRPISRTCARDTD